MISQRFNIGLTGGIGSGKTTVANFFQDLGADIIDTDLLAHQLSAPNGGAIEQIRHAFGDSYIDSQGAMDRQRMRSLVFSNPEAKLKLEQILHPLIRSECERIAQLGTGTYPIFVVPLLIESGSWANRVSRILVIDCSEETQIHRVMQRNGFPRSQVESILQAQATRSQRIASANDVIDSEVSLVQIQQQVSELHQKYLKLAQAA